MEPISGGNIKSLISYRLPISVHSNCILTDILQMKIDKDFTLERCREKLIRRYQTKTCKVQIKPWDRESVEDVKDIYTVVTMYKKDSHGKNLGEREKVTLHGSVDEIFSTKVNGMLPLRIVIIAQAGKGKTTAVAKLAYDWAYNVQGSPLEGLPLLFILRLRDVQKDTSLGQAIKDQLLSDVHELSSKQLERFMRTYQNLCWVILDGLDEFSGRITSATKSIGNIISVLTYIDLADCRILVTTRPHLENDFNQGELPKVYAKMEIEGFSHDNSRQYIDKFFRADTMQGRKLKEFLDQNDVIDELVSTPLFCLMVCYLWRENRLVGIDTQTKLLDNVNAFLWYHSKTRSSKFTEEWLESTIYRLGKVAFRGLLDDSKKLVFSLNDFKEDQAVISDGCELGIIARSESFGTYDPSIQRVSSKTSIEFYHKLAQEHAAGKYIVRKSGGVKKAFKTSELDRLFKAARKNLSDYEHVLRFAAGTNNEVCVKVMNEVLSNKDLAESERYRILFDCSSESSGFDKGVSSLMRGCISGGAVVLKSPTIYTVIGMKKLPEQIRKEVR